MTTQTYASNAHDAKMLAALGMRLPSPGSVLHVCLTCDRVPVEQRDSIRRLLASGHLATLSVVHAPTETYNITRGPRWATIA